MLQTTGSATRTGLVAFCSLAPVAVSSLFGGPLIDWSGRRRTSIGTDLACGTTVAAVPLLYYAGLLPFCAVRADGVQRAVPRARWDVTQRAALAPLVFRPFREMNYPPPTPSGDIARELTGR